MNVDLLKIENAVVSDPRLNRGYRDIEEIQGQIVLHFGKELRNNWKHLDEVLSKYGTIDVAAEIGRAHV